MQGLQLEVQVQAMQVQQLLLTRWAQLLLSVTSSPRHLRCLTLQLCQRLLDLCLEGLFWTQEYWLRHHPL